MIPSKILKPLPPSTLLRYLAGILVVLTLGLFSPAQAETITLQAITDFDAIDAGDVPFYRDTNGGRNVLAINAAIEDYRNRYAMATTDFTGTGGFYDITLTTFGELDGDCVYQVLVNGVVVGAAVNSIALEDYEVQNHVIEDIYIPAGATLGVTAVAVSNGLIPENDAYAFARGRWQTLTLTTDTGGTDFTPVVDLDLQIETTPAAATGEQIDVTLTVSNLSIEPQEFSATNPVISVVLPDALELAASAECSVNGFRVHCPLAEIASGENAVATFSVRSNTSGQHALAASVIADQRELIPANNLDSATVVLASSPQVAAALGTSSGGAWSPMLLLFLISLIRRRKARSPVD